MALLLAATVGSYVYVHNEPTSSSSPVQAVGGGQQVGGSNGTSGGSTNDASAPQPGQATSSSPDPFASPTLPPLDMGAVKRTMEAYLNAVQDHDLTATRSIVCPKFRASYHGTYSPQGYAYSGWSTHYEDALPGLNYVYVVVTQGLLDTSTGAKKGSETHSWSVERDSGTYYVCGYLT